MEQPCRNCGQILPEQAGFCPRCGQANTTGKENFFTLVRDALDTFLNLDSKLFRTLFHLFIPGKLTVEYFKGRHKSYVPPFRLFVVLTVIGFAVLAWTGNLDTSGMQLDYPAEERGNDLKHFQRISFIQKQIAREYPQAVPALDSLLAIYRTSLPGELDSIYLPVLRFSLDSTEMALTVSVWDLYKLTPDEFLEKSNENGFFKRLLLKQSFKLAQDDQSFVQYLLGKTTWAVLILLPLMALFLKLLYIRRKRYFVEHFIFSLHAHTFVLLTIILLVLWSAVWQLSDAVTLTWAGLMALYVLLALKRYYGQGWFKTLAKFFIGSIAYLILLTVSITLTALLGFLLF